MIATEGKKLVVSDLSSIEGRVLAWLAGEKWKIQAYYDIDRDLGYDMYIQTYARTFDVDPASVDKNQRQLGKTLELALGYGGGVGAFVTFANAFGIDLDSLKDAPVSTIHRDKARSYYLRLIEEGQYHFDMKADTFIALDAIKRSWRQANPAIVKYWDDLQSAILTVQNCIKPSMRVNRVIVDKDGTWLRIKLPSGRYISYAGLRVKNNDIQYLGVDTATKKWMYMSLYGGKVAEQTTQATSRDILAYRMPDIDEAGYKIVLSVHDELITEAPDTDEYTADTLSKMMSMPYKWSEGLPLAADGYESYRYRKG
jgi:DNA polymerase